ncbi:MAG: PAS domain-containing protein [Spirochaetales bacterium]|nr:PAS domain-containing protein [Spirochaetales bacterium]
MKKLQIKSIKSFIFLLFIIVVLIVNSFVFLFYYATLTKRVEKDAKKYLLSISKPVVFNLSSLLIRGDRVGIEIILANLKSNRFVKDVILFDNMGSVIIGSETDFGNQKFALINRIKFEKKLVVFKNTGSSVSCALPVYGQEFYNRTKSDLNAVLYIEADLYQFTAEAFNVLFSVFSMNLGLSVVLSLLFILILTKYIFTPLIKMTNMTEAVAKGNYIEIDEENGKYEFKNLFTSFNRMSRNLNLYTTKLEILNRNLTDEVKSRTEELEKLKNRFQGIADSAGDILWEIDEKGCYTYCSDGIANVLGYEPTAVLGRHFTFSFKDKNKALFDSSFSAQDPISFECVNGKTDGTESTLRIIGEPFFSEGGHFKGYRGVSKDISREVELKQTLRRIHRIESIGFLVGGVAHDFNNILNIVKNYADLIKRDYSIEETGEEYISEITKAVYRGSNLIKKLLALSKKGHGKKERISPVKQLDDLCRFFNRLLGSRIKVEKYLKIESGEKTEILMNATEFDQVFMNLAINSRDAMPDGGIITITEEIVSLGKKDKIVPPSPHAGKYFKVSFRDTGTGIPEKIREKVFEPFFSTKKQKQGTGLGLAIVFAIVSNSGGAVTLNSTDGRGTIFEIYLPLLSDIGE